MSESFVLAHIAGDGGSFDLIFVHGLKGDHHATWTCTESKDAGGYWPNWIAAEMPCANIYAIGYPASLFAKWAQKEMSLYELAKVAIEQMAALGLGTRPIVFITHSLGGLLTKQIIRTAHESPDASWQAIATSCKLIIFLATPHTGASLATLLNFAVPRLVSGQVDILSAGSSQLDELNQSYRTLAPKLGIKTLAYYEKHKTKNALLVVSKESADPGVYGTTPIPLDADHETICKPVARSCLLHQSVRRHLKPFESLVPYEQTTFDEDGYASTSVRDRRDLLKKMMDAGREHEYGHVNDLQNKFAQKYYKLGLHTPARQLYDDLLSDIEQRFLTHVYNEKICKGASSEEISNVLQSHVIDPIVAKYTNTQANARTVITALYFLTERCHIRWDAP